MSDVNKVAMSSDADTKLSRSVSVADYRSMTAANDRAAVGRFIVQRFHERYFEPTVDSPNRHGFTMMAIACLVIEAVESFIKGKRTRRVDHAKCSIRFSSDLPAWRYSGPDHGLGSTNKFGAASFIKLRRRQAGAFCAKDRCSIQTLAPLTLRGF